MSPQIDPAELAQLLDEHVSALELYAAQWTAEPEDCVQEAMIQLAAQSIRPPNPVAWLYLVVRNKSLNAKRAQQRRSNHERLAALLLSDRKSASGRTLEFQRLSSSLESLTSEDRELIVLRIWSGFTWQQIAELTATSSSSAQRNYVAALAKLKKIMESLCKTKLKTT